MSNNTNKLTVATASNNIGSTVALPTFIDPAVSSISIDPSSLISADDGTSVKLYVDKFQKAHR